MTILTNWRTWITASWLMLVLNFYVTYAKEFDSKTTMYIGILGMVFALIGLFFHSVSRRRY